MNNNRGKRLPRAAVSARIFRWTDAKGATGTSNTARSKFAELSSALEGEGQVMNSKSQIPISGFCAAAAL